MTFPGGRRSVRAAFSGWDGASPPSYIQKVGASKPCCPPAADSETTCIRRASSLDQFLAADLGVGRPLLDVMVGKKCAERLLVYDLAAQQLDLRLVDDVQGGLRFDTGHDSPSAA
jgi:hypothetical protein